MDIADDDLESEEIEPLPPFFLGGSIGGGGRPGENEMFKNLGGNSQNFLRQIRKIFITLRCFYAAVIHRKNYDL